MQVIEEIMVRRAAYVFDTSTDFEERRQAYDSVPEFNIQMPSVSDVLNLYEVEKGESTEELLKSATLLPFWAERVREGLTELRSSRLIQTKFRMRRELVADCIRNSGNVELQLTALREVLPPSLERTLVVRELLGQVSGDGEWLSAAVLNANMNLVGSGPHDATMRALILALSTFPGRANRLVLYLTDYITLDDLLDGTSDSAEIRETFMTIKTAFHDFTPAEQQCILQISLANAIGGIATAAKKSYSDNELTPYGLYVMYVNAIDAELIAPLGRDARVTEDILDEVKSVFLALPADIQARILLTAIQHPTNIKLIAHGANVASNLNAEAQAEIVRDIMASGGVVAVKLGQMLAEDPKVPADYRKLLGSLRDSNPAMTPTEFWIQVPATVRGKIRRLGPLLGTGSVKQVHIAEFNDGSSGAIAVLRAGVEHEALASVDALESSEQLSAVIQKLARLMFGEFNLFQEGEILIEFAKSPIGLHPLFDVVPVRHHSPRCLIEGVASGQSIPKALADSELRESVKEVLTEYHREVFRTFTDHGLVHSDIHLGNAIYGEVKSGKNGFVLFDVGQFERATRQEVLALLWLLAAISSPERNGMLRGTALANLDRVAHIRPNAPSVLVVDGAAKPGVNVLPREATTIERIGLALDEAMAPLEDGSLPDKKTAYMLFLRAAEARGMDLPGAAFAVAKMLDGMLVQQVEYDLPPVVDMCVEDFLWRNMSWTDTARIVKTSLAAQWLPRPVTQIE